MKVLRASTNYYKVEGRLNLAKLSSETETMTQLELLKEEAYTERLQAFADLEAHLDSHPDGAAGASKMHFRSEP